MRARLIGAIILTLGPPVIRSKSIAWTHSWTRFQNELSKVYKFLKLRQNFGPQVAMVLAAKTPRFRIPLRLRTKLYEAFHLAPAVDRQPGHHREAP